MIKAKYPRAGTWATTCLGALCVLLAPGCKPEKPELTEVTGIVTLDGQPLAGVIVSFYPESAGGEQLPYSKGISDGDGLYRLSVQSGESGALPGRHKVVVKWPSRDLREELGQGPPPADQMIPVRYTVVLQSPLEFEVKPGPPAKIDLRLQK